MRTKKVVEAILQLQDAIETFSHGVIVTVADLAHRGKDVMVSQELTIGVAGILIPTIFSIFSVVPFRSTVNLIQDGTVKPIRKNLSLPIDDFSI